MNSEVDVVDCREDGFGNKDTEGAGVERDAFEEGLVAVAGMPAIAIPSYHL